MSKEIEMRIARKCVREFRKRGFNLGVWDGEETTVKDHDGEDAIMKALRTTDMDRLLIYAEGQRIGSVLLVWGNGRDVISDWVDRPCITNVMDPIINDYAGAC